MEKILRQKIQGDAYWKEFCFALTAETVVDRSPSLARARALSLSHTHISLSLSFSLSLSSTLSFSLSFSLSLSLSLCDVCMCVHETARARAQSPMGPWFAQSDGAGSHWRNLRRKQQALRFHPACPQGEKLVFIGTCSVTTAPASAFTKE